MSAVVNIRQEVVEIDIGDQIVEVTLAGAQGPPGPDTAAALAALTGGSGSSLVGFTQAGAVARTLESKVRETVSVFDYATGAQQAAIIAGTSTDDTAIVQAALTGAAGRARLVFPAGTYKVNTTPNSMPSPYAGGIRVPSNSWLIFEPGATIQAIANNLSKYMVVSLYDVDNVVIEGAKIVGDRLTHTYPNLFDSLALLNAGTYRTKEDYGATFVPYAGMVAQIIAGADVGEYTYSGSAWAKTAAYNPLNYSTHEHGNCLSVINSRNVWINRCRISNGTGDGIFIGEHISGPGNTLTRGVFVTNNDIIGHRRQGISIVKGGAIAISGNTFTDIGLRTNLQDGVNPRAGIDIEAGYVEMSDNVVITDNIFRNCTGGSVINYDGVNVVIGNNTCEQYGINYGFGVNSSIVGNTLIMGASIYGNGPPTQTAFTYTQSGTVQTITFAGAHNRATGDRTYLEFFDANSRVVASGYYEVTVISSIVLTATLPTALVLASGNGRRLWPANNVTITGNTVTNGQINLIGKGMVVSGNVVRNYHGGIAIYASGTASDILVQGNSVTVAATGINAASTTSNVKIEGNVVRGCTSVGIFGACIITSNTVSESVRGIQSSGAKATVLNNTVDMTGMTAGVNGIEATGAFRHEIANNTVTGSSVPGIYTTSPALITSNRVTGTLGTTSIQATTTGANGARIIDNYVESARATGGARGIAVDGSADGVRIIRNTLVSTSAAFANAIDTSAGANSRLTNNVYMGTLSTAGTDTLVTNVAY